MKFLLLFLPFILQAVTFKIATYNVENLFDLNFSGKEYVEYIPGGRYGWNKYIYHKKIKNISRVIYDLNADIVALEEIESIHALKDLRGAIKKRGLFYRYYTIADKKNSTVKVALLSRYKIVKKEEIRVSYLDKYRNILKVKLDISGYPLILFVNHWKSKSAPESERMKYAKALKKRLSSLPKGAEYVVLGDFNSNYNEYVTFLHNKKLNNTKGKTGINHISKTTINDKMVTIKDVKQDCSLLYNLWMELPNSLRYSYIYHGEKDTIDNMLLPCSMFDKKGIDYIKNSFNVFKPDYLFKNGSIYRWQRVGGYGKFAGKGYSDHLPIYALFTTDDYHKFIKRKKEILYDEINISDLYKLKKLQKPVWIKNAIVIYKDRQGAVVKRINDRAIYIFRHNKIFKKKFVYDILVNSIKNYKENLEIDALKDVLRKYRLKDIKSYFLHYKNGMDLLDKKYANEVIYKLDGVYKKGYLYYAKDKKIRVYNKIKNFYIKTGSKIVINKARIMIYKGENEIFLSYKLTLRTISHP